MGFWRRANKASQAFVTGFTKKYAELAERSPVYAELRNVIDLVIAAAFIQQEDYCGRSGWEMLLFGNEEAFAVETYNVPRAVNTAVNAIWKGRRLMTPVGGGVTIHAVDALADYAHSVNQNTQNIGARRLYTIMERMLEELSFEAPDMKMGKVEINAAYVKQRLDEVSKDEDLSKFIL